MERLQNKNRFISSLPYINSLHVHYITCLYSAWRRNFYCACRVGRNGEAAARLFVNSAIAGVGKTIDRNGCSGTHTAQRNPCPAVERERREERQRCWRTLNKTTGINLSYPLRLAGSHYVAAALCLYRQQ